MSIEILYEDEFILAVNKPNNCLIHQSYYARNIKTATLLAQLEVQQSKSYYPIHRLDHKTSGIILLAKEKEHVSHFQLLFDTNEIQKTYAGIVRGFVKDNMTIDTPVKNKETGVYKDAKTHVICKSKIEIPIAVQPYATSRYSLVKLQPKTGRMHQLRIHLNKVSHPLIGDYTYGDRFHNRMFETEFDCHNLFLHATSLEFTHPFLKQKVILNAAFPNDWNRIFEKFNWNL